MKSGAALFESSSPSVKRWPDRGSHDLAKVGVEAILDCFDHIFSIPWLQ
jgi:hypothetical protein